MPEVARKLPDDDAQDLRMRVCRILRSSKLPKDNITRSQRAALKEMRKWEDDVILPANKGNATVVMEREDYDRKVRELLSDATTYRKLPRDPTQAQEAKLSRKLKALEKGKEICGQVYIGETRHRLGTRLKEHRDACKKGLTDKSAIAVHAWTNDHPIRWDATKVLQRASRTMELVMKESLSIQTKPESERFNRDSGFKLPDCWIATYKKLRGGASMRTTHAHLNA